MAQRNKERTPTHLHRLYLIALLCILTLAAYVQVLYDIQIVHHEEYARQAVRSITRQETVDAPRGGITDRNGRPLVTNRSTYSLTFDPALVKGDEDVNTAILRLIQLCQSQGVEWIDNLPVSRGEPFTFRVDMVSDLHKTRFLSYLRELDESRKALAMYLALHPEVVQSAEEPTETDETINIGADGEIVSLSAVVENISADVGATENRDNIIINNEENENTGKKSNKKLNPEDEAAAREARLLKKGESLLQNMAGSRLSNALLEAAGITADQMLTWMRKDFKIPEEYTPLEARLVLAVQYELEIRKIGGTNTSYVFADDIDTVFISVMSDGRYSGGKVIQSYVREYQTSYAAHILGNVGKLNPEDLKNPAYEGYPMDAVVGKNGVELAFEEYLHGVSGKQVVSMTEDGKVTGVHYKKTPQSGGNVELTLDLDLQRTLEETLAQTISNMTARDNDYTRGGAAVIMKVDTAEVLAMGSYPTYDLSTFRKSEVNAELNANPAHPFQNRATSSAYPPGSTLKPLVAVAALESGAVTTRERIYDSGCWYYPNYPASHAYCWNRSGHGSLNITGAITNSCNYYFAEMGYRLGMNRLCGYLESFGLGLSTGIEISEKVGNLPHNDKGSDYSFMAGFGQSNQAYTPLQMCNYVCTLASGGRHYSAHLLKSVKSHDNTQTLVIGNTEPVNVVDISQEHLAAVLQGMLNYTTFGDVSRYYVDCVVSAGAKTGTAQLGGGQTNNGVFITFAPFENPEIAIAIAIEHAGAGAALATTAVTLINAYFTAGNSDSVITGEDQLLP